MKQHIIINLTDQSLCLYEDNQLMVQYAVSTAKNGAGEKMDSECTPRGKHVIAEKIGDGCDQNTVFVGRQATGEVYRPALRNQYPERDWILTRILWLKGTEAGRNLGDDVDSYDRFIYIHGAPDDVEMGQPGSRGCIRMRNEDVIELFNRVSEGIGVTILE